MPLRDHFQPPVSKKASWEGFHGMWPANIVQQLRKQLPPGYVAEPRVHLGTLMEIDVGALESNDVRGLLPVGDERDAGAARNLVAHPGGRPAAADAPPLVARRPGYCPRSGAELRAGLQ